KLWSRARASQACGWRTSPRAGRRDAIVSATTAAGRTWVSAVACHAPCPVSKAVSAQPAPLPRFPTETSAIAVPGAMQSQPERRGIGDRHHHQARLSRFSFSVGVIAFLSGFKNESMVGQQRQRIGSQFVQSRIAETKGRLRTARGWLGAGGVGGGGRQIPVTVDVPWGNAEASDTGVKDSLKENLIRQKNLWVSSGSGSLPSE